MRLFRSFLGFCETRPGELLAEALGKMKIVIGNRRNLVAKVQNVPGIGKHRGNLFCALVARLRSDRESVHTVRMHTLSLGQDSKGRSSFF